MSSDIIPIFLLCSCCEGLEPSVHDNLFVFQDVWDYQLQLELLLIGNWNRSDPATLRLQRSSVHSTSKRHSDGLRLE